MNPYHTGVVFMSGEHLIMEPLDGVREWMLFRSYAVLINGQVVTIPEGFITDLASVPAAVRVLIDDDDPDMIRPAVIHDFLYKHCGRPKASMTFTRRECDGILSAAMRACGAPVLRRSAVYAGVRIGGWVAWGKHGCS